MIGWGSLLHFLNQWEAIPKPIVPWSHMFSSAWCQLHVITLNSDWFIAPFVSCDWPE